MDTELQVLAESLVELGEIILVLGNLAEHVHTLLDDVLTNDLEDFVLLKSLTRDVEREILGVNNTLDEVEVFGNDVLAVVHDKDATDVEFDIVTLLFGLEEVERSTIDTV